MTHLGSTPLVAWATMRTIGFAPSSFALAALVTTTAAAPSFTPGALPAVTVPSFLKAGLNERRISMVVSSRGDSSLSKMTGAAPFFFAGISTGTICDLNLHSFIAADRFAMRVHRELILLFAGDAIFFGNVLAGDAHVVVVVNIPQAVAESLNRRFENRRGAILCALAE